MLEEELKLIAQKVAKRIAVKNLKVKTLTLEVKFSDFEQMTRNHSFTNYIADEATIEQTAIELLHKIDLEDKKVRLLGITLSNFPIESKFKEEQLRLF